MFPVINPPYSPNFAALTVAEVRRYYDWFLAAMPSRIAELAELVNETPGFKWTPDQTPESLDVLGRWFAQQVSTRPRSKEEVARIAQGNPYPIDIPSEELTDETFAVSLAVAMYFSQVFLRREPTVRWHHSLEGKGSINYGQPVLIGFGKKELNPVQIVNTLAYAIANREKGGARLRELYDYWASHIVRPSNSDA